MVFIFYFLYPTEGIDSSENDENDTNELQGRHRASDAEKFLRPHPGSHEFIRRADILQDKDSKPDNQKTDKKIHKKGLKTFIADAADRQDDIVTNLMTDIFDMCIDRPVVEEIRIAHDLTHEILTGNDLPFPGDDVLEELEFGFCQERFRVSPDDHQLRLDQSQVSVDETFFSGLRGSATQDGLDAHDDFLWTEGFADIVVGFEFK